MDAQRPRFPDVHRVGDGLEHLSAAAPQSSTRRAGPPEGTEGPCRQYSRRYDGTHALLDVNVLLALTQLSFIRLSSNPAFTPVLCNHAGIERFLAVHCGEGIVTPHVEALDARRTLNGPRPPGTATDGGPGIGLGIGSG